MHNSVKKKTCVGGVGEGGVVVSVQAVSVKRERERGVGGGIFSTVSVPVCVEWRLHVGREREKAGRAFYNTVPLQ